MKSRLSLSTLTFVTFVAISNSAIAAEKIVADATEAGKLVANGFVCSEVLTVSPGTANTTAVTFKITTKGRKPVTKTDQVPKDAAARIYKAGVISCSDDMGDE